MIIVNTKDYITGNHDSNGLQVECPGVDCWQEQGLSSPLHPEWLWGPLSILCSGHWGQFTKGKAARA